MKESIFLALGLLFLETTLVSGNVHFKIKGARPWRRNALANDYSFARPCSNTIMSTLFQGAALRIASDLSGGTAFESVKTRVATTKEGPLAALTNIVKDGGVFALWTGTQSRIIEGALVGGVFMVASTVVKGKILAMGGSPTLSALLAGLSGGVAQSIVMTPAGMVFTSLNVNRGKEYKNDNAITITRRIVKEKGITGMYGGGGAMCLRQATNWASRAGFTELARTTFRLSEYGLLGEIGSGVIGGLGSCWNTPIELARMRAQRDISMSREPSTIIAYWKETINDEGVSGLFRGLTPRAMQAIWQTCFMIVVPNLLGL
jgi:hypothetical protein